MGREERRWGGRREGGRRGGGREIVVELVDARQVMFVS